MQSNNVSIGYNWVGFSGGGLFWNLLQANEKEQDIIIPLQVLQFVEWGLGMYCSKNLSQIHLNIEAFQSIDFLKLGCMLNSISDLSHCKNSYCEKFCQSTPIDFWSNILSVKSRNWTCQQTSEGGMVLVLYVPPLLPLNHSRLLDPPKSTLLTIGRKTTRVRIQILSIDGRSYGQMLIY